MTGRALPADRRPTAIARAHAGRRRAVTRIPLPPAVPPADGHRGVGRSAASDRATVHPEVVR
jgi:hypothetical protein